MLTRPSSCHTCALHEHASGFAPPEGPETSPIVFLGEALGATEAATGRPFVGDAGSMLQRLFTILGWDRASFRIANTVSCRPPNDWLDHRAPYYFNAINHCAIHREPVFATPHLKVVVAMGATAIRTALGLLHTKKVRVEDFHGAIVRDPTDRFWVVPTFHPSFLQRGAHNLIGTVIWDLQRAQQALQGKPEDPGSLVIDPPLEWFRSWVDTVIAARTQDPGAYPLSEDVETPDKAGGRDEGEITAEDRSYEILRVNVACHPDEGITVPYTGPYIDELKRLNASPGPIWMWNKEYDVPRLIAAGQLGVETDPRFIDLMWLWHFLQSDVPRGLGFAAPFYSDWGPWKHLSDAEPAKYGAIDGLQNHRCGFGILGDLHRTGMYQDAMRHVHQLHHLVLKPAQQVGVKIDRQRLQAYNVILTEKANRALDAIQQCVPDALQPLTPKGGMTRRPADNLLHAKATAFTRKGTERKGKKASEVKLDLYKRATVVEKTIEREVWVCRTCGDVEVQRRHRCKPVAGAGKRRKADPPPPASVVELESRPVVRYFWQEPFNPDSWQQVLAYIKYRKHTPGKAKKTRKDTTDRETLERLVKTGDPFYARLLDFRAVQKVKGTYVDGTEKRMDADDRIHPEPTFKPSTMRLSYVNPNITNVVTRARPGRENLAEGYRKCVVASPGCRLLEVDFSGSEAVDVGWFARRPDYIELARLGVHAGLASHILGRPYDPSWSLADKAAYFKEIKESKDVAIIETYDRSKRFVHGYSYGLTIQGMVLQFPEIFPTKKIAEQYERIFQAMAPGIPKWQRNIRERAWKQKYLGGPGDHPFGYKHWFWSVFTFKKITASQYYAIQAKWRRSGRTDDPPITEMNGQYFKISLGDDGKRCVAFYPQSTTAGKLKDAMLRLFDPEQPSFIGDAYFGKTPLRAPIHDSLLLEIPQRKFDLVASIVFREMQRPIVNLPCPEEWGIGPYLTTGVSAKTGLDWGTTEKMTVPGFEQLGASDDWIVTSPDEDGQEDLDDFERVVA